MQYVHADVSDIHASTKHFECGDAIKKLMYCRIVLDFTQDIMLVIKIQCKRKFQQLALPYLEVL